MPPHERERRRCKPAARSASTAALRTAQSSSPTTARAGPPASSRARRLDRLVGADVVERGAHAVAARRRRCRAAAPRPAGRRPAAPRPRRAAAPVRARTRSSSRRPASPSVVRAEHGVHPAADDPAVRSVISNGTSTSAGVRVGPRAGLERRLQLGEVGRLGGAVVGGAGQLVDVEQRRHGPALLEPVVEGGAAARPRGRRRGQRAAEACAPARRGSRLQLDQLRHRQLVGQLDLDRRPAAQPLALGQQHVDVVRASDAARSLRVVRARPARRSVGHAGQHVAGRRARAPRPPRPRAQPRAVPRRSGRAGRPASRRSRLDGARIGRVRLGLEPLVRLGVLAQRDAGTATACGASGGVPGVAAGQQQRPGPGQRDVGQAALLLWCRSSTASWCRGQPLADLRAGLDTGAGRARAGRRCRRAAARAARAGRVSS